MGRKRKPQPQLDPTSPTSFQGDLNLWAFAIQNLDADEASQRKQDFLSLYERGASPKEAAYAAKVSYRQILIWQDEDTWFASEISRIATYRWDHPELAKKIFLDFLSERHDEYGAAEAAGMPLGQFKQWRREDPKFRKAWKYANKACVSKVEGRLFSEALHGDNFLDRVTVMNAHKPEIYKPENVKNQGNPQGQITINVNVAIDPRREPKRLPLQTGNELSLPEGDVEEDDA